jgi:hypothetical protein
LSSGRALTKPPLASSFGEALKRGVPVLALLAALDALIVTAALWAHPVSFPPGTPPLPVPWQDPGYAAEQVVIHIVAGFAVGTLAGGLTAGFIGAGMGPLIDVDHLAAAFGYTYAARDGHSLIVLGALILVVWGLGIWRWGALDFALFSTAQFMTHFAVAPPGFPLLAPVETMWLYLPVGYYVIVTALCLVGTWVVRNRDAGRTRRDTSIRPLAGSTAISLCYGWEHNDTLDGQDSLEKTILPEALED